MYTRGLGMSRQLPSFQSECPINFLISLALYFPHCVPWSLFFVCLLLQEFNTYPVRINVLWSNDFEK